VSIRSWSRGIAQKLANHRLQQSPLDAGVLSITQIHAGSACVIPDDATLISAHLHRARCWT
jgi:metal-dependent amidase/aminoacylase/carboxypeptidase family protein